MTNNGSWRNRIVGQGEVAPDQLLANPSNFRVHPRAQQEALAGSLEGIGWIQQVIVNRHTGHVVDGHLRVQLALRNDEPVVPVLYVDMTEDEERQALLSLDPIAAMAATDKAKLDDLLRSVNSDDERVQQMLADLAQAHGLDYGAPLAEDPGAQVNKAEELRQKWGTAPGQLWEIGQHRIICGDCTDPATVERLMGGEKADMVFTDPPYNVAGNSRNYAADVSKSMNDLKDADWDQDFDITTFFPMLEEVIANDCAVYICTSHWLVHIVWEWMWAWSDFCSYNVWCKPNPMPSLSRRHWTWATELIAYAVRGKHISNFPNHDGHALNWWDIAKHKDTEHPTEKPIEVPERALGFSSNEGQIVFDPFLGSGTTLVACERLGRYGRGIEISPAYVAVALERLAGMGLDARVMD